MNDEKPLAPGLYLVATPIGNLEDMTLRALRVLRLADKIACEDTRQTQKLLNHFEIRTPTVSYHLFNEAARAQELIAELEAAAAIAAGIAVVPVPGANAALAALVASGLPVESFAFHGFLPSKAGARRTALETLPRVRETHVFYETPHRILEALTDVVAVFGAAQRVVVARELTKLHEEFLRGTVGALRAQLASRASVRGEIVLLLALTEPEADETVPLSIADEVAALIAAEGLSEMAALKRVARERGMGKSEAYRELQREQNRRR
jgi:16S rRNA (cytidine1402-2'-O)-methyltransferase